jgi:hypothetical protein
MEYSIELIQVPNQSFRIEIEGNIFEIRLRTFRGVTFASISQGDNMIEAGVRCIPNSPIFGGAANSLIKGKLMFKCRTDDFPFYGNFDGVTCSLVYIQE